MLVNKGTKATSKLVWPVRNDGILAGTVEFASINILNACGGKVNCYRNTTTFTRNKLMFTTG